MAELESTVRTGGLRRSVTELLLRLRTEGDSPGRQGLAVAVGGFIGFLPLYGLHLPLCVAASRLLRLNLVKMFLVTNVNNPLLAPLLVYADLQVGSLLRRGHPYPHSLEAVRGLDPWAFAADLVLGSVVLGVAFGAAVGLAAWALVRRERKDRAWTGLLEQTSRRYLRAGLLHWELTRAQMRLDRSYLQLIERELADRPGTIRHLGCGRGVVLALLDAARHPRGEAADGDVVDGDRSLDPALLHGVEPGRRAARVAARALGSSARIDHAPLEGRPVPPSGGIVLPRMRLGAIRPWQGALLGRAAAALEPGGVLVLRLRPSLLGRLTGRSQLHLHELVATLEASGLRAARHHSGPLAATPVLVATRPTEEASR